MHGLESIAIAGLTSTILPVMILIPISIYGNIKLYSFRNELFVKKRSLPILFGFNVSCCLSSLTLSATTLCIFIPDIPVIFSTISLICTGCLTLILLFLLNLKTWLIYFQYKWNLNCTQNKWQSLINPKVNDEPNWYIDNHHKYGNVKYMSKIFGIVHLILAMFGGSCRYFRMNTSCNEFNCNGSILNNSNIYLMGMLLAGIIPLIFYLYIFCKTPSFNDYYFIHWESKMHSRILLCLFLFSIIFHIIGNITNREIQFLIVAPVIWISFFALNYVSTFVLIRKNMQSEPNKMTKPKQMKEASGITLEQILSSNEAMDELIVHLFEEYSIECLVSFIEIEQYQWWLMRNIIRNSNQDDRTDVHHKPLNKIKLYDIHPEIRQSAFMEKLVCNNSDNNLVANAKLAALKLYEKYIKVGSELEINISALLRKELRDILSDKERLMANTNITSNDLLLLFEKPKDKMKLLLNYSHQRFKQKAEYLKVVEIINKASSSKFRRLSLSITNNI